MFSLNFDKGAIPILDEGYNFVCKLWFSWFASDFVAIIAASLLKERVTSLRYASIITATVGAITMKIFQVLSERYSARVAVPHFLDTRSKTN